MQLILCKGVGLGSWEIKSATGSMVCFVVFFFFIEPENTLTFLSSLSVCW